MAGRNCPIPGGIRSRRWPRPASMSWRPTCAASAGPARRPISRPTASFDNVGDMVALVAALGEKQAVIVGHDWGAPVAWHAAMFRPDIFTRVAGLSVPPPFRGRGRPLETLRAERHHQFLLAVFSAARRRRSRVRARRRADHAHRARRPRLFRSLGASVRRGRQGLSRRRQSRPAAAGLARPRPTSPISPRSIRQSGFRGGLNWYRNIDRNWELTAPWQDAQIHQPSLFIAGSKDSVITGLIGAKRVADMERVLPNLTAKIILDGAGHWVQQERAGRGQRGPDRFPESLRMPAVPADVLSTARARSGIRAGRADRSAHRR